MVGASSSSGMKPGPKLVSSVVGMSPEVPSTEVGAVGSLGGVEVGIAPLTQSTHPSTKQELVEISEARSSEVGTDQPSYAQVARIGVERKRDESSGDVHARPKAQSGPRGGGSRALSYSQYPSISMQENESEFEGDPLASPPHYQCGSGVRVQPKSFAAITRENYVKPVFEDIPLRNAVLQNGKQVMVFLQLRWASCRAPSCGFWWESSQLDVPLSCRSE